MTSLFKIFFCKTYQFFKYLDVDTIPEYSAISILSVLLTLNLVTLYFYIRWLAGYHAKVNIPIGLVAFIFLATMGICYLLIVKDGKYIRLYKTFSKSKINTEGTASLIAISYFLLSFCAMFSVIWVHWISLHLSPRQGKFKKSKAYMQVFTLMHWRSPLFLKNHIHIYYNETDVENHNNRT